MTDNRYVGRPVTRREDGRLLCGRLFVADVRVPGLVEMAVLRSPHAHDRVLRVDTRDARSCRGVLAALSFADLGTDVPHLPMLVQHAALRPHMPYPLAAEKVL